MGSIFYNGWLISQLPQQGIFLLLFVGCGALLVLPVLTFVSSVIGWIVYELRKKKVNPDKAKSQAIIIAVISFLLLAGTLAAYFFHDLYIP